MLLESDLTGCAAHLLVPDQTVEMTMPGGDHVVQPVPVDVVHQHLGSSVGKLVVMADPRLSWLRVGGLFPPATAFQHVDAAVAVDVTDAHAVRVFLITTLSADRMECPRLVRFGWVPGAVTQESVDVVDQVGASDRR